MNLRLTLALTGLALMSSPLLVPPAVATPAEASAAIEYLLDYVANSDIVFVRNGKNHTPAEAVQHMRRKYEYYEKKIHTAEDFIALAASKSTMSGKPYTVRIDANEIPAADWLTGVLGAYRQGIAAGESP